MGQFTRGYIGKLSEIRFKWRFIVGKINHELGYDHGFANKPIIMINY